MNDGPVSEKSDFKDVAEGPNDRRGSSDEERTVDNVPIGQDLDDNLKDSLTAKVPITQPEQFEHDFPDGGLRAWLVVFGVSRFKPSTVFC